MAQASTTPDPHITALDETDGSFQVESRTRPGLSHTVNVPARTCTCEAGQHGIECWHLDFCRAVFYWHRYDRRAQLWEARAARVAATKAVPAAGMAALQECYPTPTR